MKEPITRKDASNPDAIPSRPKFSSIRDLETSPKQVREALLAFALSITSQNRERAEDLVQDAFVNALANKEKFEEGTSLLSWMWRIIRNADVDRHRAEKLRGWLNTPFDISDAPPGSVPDSTPATQEAPLEWKAFLAAFERLEPAQQELITCVASGVPYKEMASIFGVPLGTIMSRLARIRARLREETGRGE